MSDVRGEPSGGGGDVRGEPSGAGSGCDVALLRGVVGAVVDPELPVLTLDDLGIVRDLRLSSDGAVEVDLTPTYTGCPATAVIAADVEAALRAAGARRTRVCTVLSPAWTTAWMSEDGRRKLRAYGIAPPGPVRQDGPVPLALAPRCPLCGASGAREVSRFGSTPCKGLWACRSCREPFDAFRAI